MFDADQAVFNMVGSSSYAERLASLPYMTHKQLGMILAVELYPRLRYEIRKTMENYRW